MCVSSIVNTSRVSTILFLIGEYLVAEPSGWLTQYLFLTCLSFACLLSKGWKNYIIFFQPPVTRDCGERRYSYVNIYMCVYR